MSDPHLLPTKAPLRIGLLGGTFDPIHLAHLVVAQEVAARLDLTHVLFIPAGSPPHKLDKAITSAQHRRAMVALAIRDEPRFALYEGELARAGPSYTSDTITELRVTFGLSALVYLIMGGDMLESFAQWHAPEIILRGVTGIAAVHRPDFPPTTTDPAGWDAQLPGLGAALVPVAVPQIELSSTLIRDRVAQHLPIRYLVPDAVRDYIGEHGLYQAVPEHISQGGAR